MIALRQCTYYKRKYKRKRLFHKSEYLFKIMNLGETSQISKCDLIVINVGWLIAVARALSSDGLCESVFRVFGGRCDKMKFACKNAV